MTVEGWSSAIPSNTQKFRVIRWAKSGAKKVLSYMCILLLVVDVISNNWEVIDYIANAKHLLTPLLDVNSPTDMLAQYSFPEMASPLRASKVGRFMINSSFASIQARDSSTFMLGTTTHDIVGKANDICGQLVDKYPITDLNATTMQLGSVVDSITFIRGNVLSHWFGDSKTAPRATTSMNETQLRAMGYAPGRLSTDLRLTTPVAIPPPGQNTTASISMYRYFMKGFCSGCVPGTELGLDTCVIEYSLNAKTKSLDVYSSKAIMGGTHELGFIFLRRGGPILALYTRFFTLLLLFGVYAASQKTVQWVDFVQQTVPQRLVRLIAPPLYRQPCSILGLSDICFNSDVFVVLYSLAVLGDEEISMVYSRVLNRWYVNSSFNLWIELRLMSMTVRWLWLNCFLLKLAKWICHFVSMAQYTGANRVMGWLNFSSVSWMYLSVCVLFERNDFIEFGNSVNVDLHSTTQNLDATYVLLFESWYVRGLPALAVMVVGNLAVLLAVDHVVNRKWWVAMAHNSLGRQLIYNSTSILADFRGTVFEKPGYAGTCVKMKIRAWCTLRWFLSSHLTCLGLAEQPSVMRAMRGTATATTHKSKSPKRHGRDDMSSTDDTDESHHVKPIPAVHPHDEEDDDGTSQCETTPTSMELHVVVQDREGHIHVIDGEKREMQALAVEVKILRDVYLNLG
ncbi:hypothetical protein DYB32_004794 [Aphanomyces invadans]|uniref:Uncharacterized protein n=1 Tax=Aphanomyces invadans TaxID=157072 RepID=A0A3R6VXG9_9STRA|nr:hypothetical protein DYB32_004794 [Aphanomyces invadans]